MAEKRWKATERKIARKLGGARVPITGRQRGDRPDVDHTMLSIECKDRQRLPDWLHDGMDQAKKSAVGTQIPVVILHQKGKRHDDDFAVVKLRDLVELVKEWLRCPQ